MPEKVNIEAVKKLLAAGYNDGWYAVHFQGGVVQTVDPIIDGRLPWYFSRKHPQNLPEPLSDPPEPLPPGYSVDQVARALNVTDQSIRNWIKAGVLGASRNGFRKWHITQEQLDAFKNRGVSESGAASRSGPGVAASRVKPEKIKARQLRLPGTTQTNKRRS